MCWLVFVNLTQVRVIYEEELQLRKCPWHGMTQKSWADLYMATEHRQAESEVADLRK